MESTIHGLAEPDMFVRLALAAPPVLAWDAGSVGVDTGLTTFHVAEDLDGICSAAQVGIHIVIACQRAREPSDHWNLYHYRLHLQSTFASHLPLFHSGWQSWRSLHVRAGFLRVPSGLRMSSSWLVMDLSVESTSMSCCLMELDGSSARMYLMGSGPFSCWDSPAKADMSMPGPGGPGGPGGPALPGGPWGMGIEREGIQVR